MRGLVSGEAKPAVLAMAITFSALGRFSVCNRLRLEGYRLFHSVGFTAGWGHFHKLTRLFVGMRDFLATRGHLHATRIPHVAGAR